MPVIRCRRCQFENRTEQVIEACVECGRRFDLDQCEGARREAASPFRRPIFQQIEAMRTRQRERGVRTRRSVTGRLSSQSTNHSIQAAAARLRDRYLQSFPAEIDGEFWCGTCDQTFDRRYAECPDCTKAMLRQEWREMGVRRDIIRQRIREIKEIDRTIERERNPTGHIPIDFTDTSPRGVSMPEGYWKMKNGKFIKITDMSDNHLTNTIKIIEKRRPVDVLLDEYIPYRKMVEELEKRKNKPGARRIRVK